MSIPVWESPLCIMCNEEIPQEDVDEAGDGGFFTCETCSGVPEQRQKANWNERARQIPIKERTQR